MFRNALFMVMVSAALLTSPSFAREQIRIVGSSTVYPFVTIAAEQFGMDGDFRTPIVEATGTGGGFKLFCSGVGVEYPDVNNASRAITESEVKQCAENGIHDVLEVPIGFDGIVIGNTKAAEQFKLTKKQLFLALARELPDASGAMHENKYKTWKEIDASLPNHAIIVYGPPPTSGTRDAFVELAMEKGCEDVAGFKIAYPDKSIRKKKCGLIREDGAFIEAGEDDNLIVQKLLSNENAIGIIGFAFYEENRHKVQASIINNVAPTTETIENGSYAVARSLYTYFKKEHLVLVPGLSEFATELVSTGAIGPEGYLVFNGLIPMPEKTRSETISKVNRFNLKQ